MDKIVNPVIGEEITFLTTSKQSNGVKTLLEVTIGPKGGNPLHYHKRFSETFIVLDGELSVQVGEEKMKVGEKSNSSDEHESQVLQYIWKTSSLYLRTEPCQRRF